MSNLKNFLFTSESVSEGHPDKVSDRISDMVVDSYLSGDPFSRVACETLTTTNKVVLAGEVRGPEIKKNSFNELKFLPLICYEIIYSGNLASDYDFDFIMNISEDGWFGKSIGPKQHFAHSIFRAIESGKYLFRSANNGISAIINPLGEVEQQIDFVNSGYIDFEKKRDLNKTVFSTYGNIIFIILILLYIFLAFSFNKIRNE